MHTRASLLDIHDRTHRGLAVLIDHCRQLTHVQLCQDLDGFGYPSIQQQICHIVGAEMYWVGVLCGRMDTEELAAGDPGLTAMSNFREDAFGRTEAYLHSVTDDDLNTAREFVTWADNTKLLVPAQVILRTQTHVFQHQGQITAMCRHHGAPVNGIDYSHEP